jgi:PAS domain S-box-containing protein
MTQFRDLSIHRKLLAMTLLVSGTVLTVALSVLFTYQVLSFHSSFKRDTATLAEIIANNSTAALAFDDRKAAGEILASLKAKPTVRGACLTDRQGAVIASAGHLDFEAPNMFPSDKEFLVRNGMLQYTQPVILEGRVLGRLYLENEYRSALLDLLRFYGLLILMVAAASGLLAVLLSGRLRRTITDPMLDLVATAKTVGEKNDYSVRAPVSDRGDELGLLAVAFNHMLSRIEDQDAALNLSQRQLEALVHSIDGIVWECRPDGRKYTFVSRQVERLLGYTPEQWLAREGFRDEKIHPADLARLREEFDAAVARCEAYHCEYRMATAGGRTVWIHENGVVLAENNKPVAVRGILQDITEQKRAAAELEELNKRFVETSRRAGMAEIASGVLHNVGNVLNSVNVSATLVQDELERSTLNQLHRGTDLLRQHLADAAGFIASDPKGRLLPGFLVKAADRAREDQERWQEELRSLKKNIEHIKEIVAMQQSYSRAAGLIECLEASDLIEDALQINTAGLHKRGIEVVRDYAQVPKVRVDKHKALQILVNLVRNAEHALVEAPASPKRLTVGIAPPENGCVTIRVQDNGIGIPRENLAKIFSHGFTTKKDGHGFGLHMGALAAKELGGSLTAHSEGQGKGATFTLELPVASNGS